MENTFNIVSQNMRPPDGYVQFRSTVLQFFHIGIKPYPSGERLLVLPLRTTVHNSTPCELLNGLVEEHARKGLQKVRNRCRYMISEGTDAYVPQNTIAMLSVLASYACAFLSMNADRRRSFPEVCDHACSVYEGFVFSCYIHMSELLWDELTMIRMHAH